MRPSQDRAFQPRNTSLANEMTVRCKHCSKMIPVDSVEEHEAYFCPLKPVRCQHFKANGEMCGFVCSGVDALQDHCKTCKDHPRKRRSVSIREGGSPRGTSERGAELCDDCQQVFPDRASLTEHQRICPTKSVPCPLHCGLWMQRQQVPDHILETAIKHKPLRRPSAVDYGGDNIHMVVAVLMEALQNAKKASQQQKALYEKTMSNIEATMSFNYVSPRHSDGSLEKTEEAATTAAAVVAAGSPKSPNSASLRVAGSAASNGLPADIAISAAASFAADSSEDTSEKTDRADGVVVAVNSPASPQIEQDNQDGPHLLNEAKAEKPAVAPQRPRSAPALDHQRATHPRKRKAAAGTKGRKSTATAAAPPPPPPVKASFRATPLSVGAPPSKLRYEDFVLKSPNCAVRVKSPPRSVRLRPTHSHPAVSPRAQRTTAAEISPQLQPPQSPSAVSSPTNFVNAV